MDFSRSGRSYRDRCNRWAMLLGLPAWVGALPAMADNSPGFDRPGLGFSPTVLAPGQLAYEQGLPTWHHNIDGGVRSDQYAADSLLRLGMGENLELQLGGSLYNHLRQRGNGQSYSSHGHGDSNLALKLALPSSNANWNWGLLGGVEFTDGARDFRNARRQYSLALDANRQLDDRHVLGYYAQWQHMGGQSSYLAAANYNYALTTQLNVYGEAVLQHDPANGNGSLIGTGLAWMSGSRVQLDGWCRHRLGGHADQWQAGLGIAVVLGR